VVKGNPMREDMNEVPNILKEYMKIEHRILDFVLNQDGSLVKAVYGDPNLAHQQLAENFSRRAHSVQSRPSPMVLTRADGPVGQEFPGKTQIKFYRTIDDALRSKDSKRYEWDVAIIPYASSTVPVAS